MPNSSKDQFYHDLTLLVENNEFSDQIQFSSTKADEVELLRNCLELIRGPKNPKQTNYLIGFFGPLGVGKTTLATALASEMQATTIVKEPYSANPFWAKSQHDHHYMLRSQIYFLVHNVLADQIAVNQQHAVSDTSTLTDIIMWAKWYQEIGFLHQDEYTLYTRFVQLIQLQIPFHHLLVIMLPDQVSHLLIGIHKRQLTEPSRSGELFFTQADLEVQIERVNQSIPILKTTWHTPTLTLKVNPIELYQSTQIQAQYVAQIISVFRENLV